MYISEKNIREKIIKKYKLNVVFTYSVKSPGRARVYIQGACMIAKRNEFVKKTAGGRAGYGNPYFKKGLEKLGRGRDRVRGVGRAAGERRRENFNFTRERRENILTEIRRLPAGADGRRRETRATVGGGRRGPRRRR